MNEYAFYAIMIDKNSIQNGWFSSHFMLVFHHCFTICECIWAFILMIIECNIFTFLSLTFFSLPSFSLFSYPFFFLYRFHRNQFLLLFFANPSKTKTMKKTFSSSFTDANEISNGNSEYTSKRKCFGNKRNKSRVWRGVQYQIQQQQ